jgi:hypothetical protein
MNMRIESFSPLGAPGVVGGTWHYLIGFDGADGKITTLCGKRIAPSHNELRSGHASSVETCRQCRIGKSVGKVIEQ